MKIVIVDAKVVAADARTAMATLIDSNEIDDLVKYEILMPTYFGGCKNPWPKVGEQLRLCYDRSAFARNPIQNVWRQEESLVPA